VYRNILWKTLLKQLSVLAVWILLVSVGASATETTVVGIRVGEHLNTTRIVVDLTQPTGSKIYSSTNPNKVTFELSTAKRSPTIATELQGRLIKSIRLLNMESGGLRIVLETSTAVRIHNAFNLPRQGSNHDRLVVDLTPASSRIKNTDAASQAKHAQSTNRVPKKRPKAAENGLIPLIVLDAGHGGVDPGAIGAMGTLEKDVTLAVALEIRKELLKSGRYRVSMTRKSDRFIKLRDRVAWARIEKADIFLSIHADSIGKTKVRGASAYTLSETASDAEALALAERENRSDIIVGIDLSEESDVVSGILIDLAQRETMNLSANLANKLILSLGKATRLLEGSHRHAGFAVLKAPDIPSVLLELGYLSNSHDEKILASSRLRAPIVHAIVSGIDSFFEDPLLADHIEAQTLP
tara:strand:+ start:319 stop:1551 length:1233 start_codon:yes stop_codon:yes gene_type:complete